MEKKTQNEEVTPEVTKEEVEHKALANFKETAKKTIVSKKAWLKTAAIAVGSGVVGFVAGRITGGGFDGDYEDDDYDAETTD